MAHTDCVAAETESKEVVAEEGRIHCQARQPPEGVDVGRPWQRAEAP